MRRRSLSRLIDAPPLDRLAVAPTRPIRRCDDEREAWVAVAGEAASTDRGGRGGGAR